MVKVCFAALLLLLAACAPFKDTPYLDDEFGKGTQAAFDAQIIHKDQPHAGKVPAGMAGVTAEEVMSVRHKMYGEKIRRGNFIEFGMQGSK